MNSDIKQNSRYNLGGTTTVEDGFLKYWDKFSFQKSESDSSIIIDENFAGRPDKLAFAMYNDSDLAWFILQYNDIIDVHEEFITGKKLYIPTPDRLKLELLKR